MNLQNNYAAIIIILLIIVIALIIALIILVSSRRSKPLPQDNSTTDETLSASPVTQTISRIIIDNNDTSYTVPKGIAFDENYLPYRINRSEKKTKLNFGFGFNAYILKGSRCYHKKSCKQITGKKNIRVQHIYDAIINPRLHPCSYCKPNSQIDEWYIKMFPMSKYAIYMQPGTSEAEPEAVQNFEQIDFKQDDFDKQITIDEM